MLIIVLMIVSDPSINLFIFCLSGFVVLSNLIVLYYKFNVIVISLYVFSVLFIGLILYFIL